MIHVEFDPTTLDGEKKKWWDRWQERAGKAIRKAIEDADAGREIDFNSDIWGELKDWLLEHFFNGKCAYCETFIGPRFFGDAEHYRPKGRVTVRRAAVEIKGRPHPGYYWLAYHWKNLVPACQYCNTVGKGTEFPIALGRVHVDHYRPDLEDPDALVRGNRAARFCFIPTRRAMTLGSTWSFGL